MPKAPTLGKPAAPSQAAAPAAQGNAPAPAAEATQTTAPAAEAATTDDKPATAAGEPPASTASPDAPKSLEDGRGRKLHPALKVIEDPKDENYGEPTVRLEAVPDNYNPDIHQSLKKKHFKTDDIYYDFRAAQCREEADGWAKKAETFRKFGDAETRQAAMKLNAITGRIAELREQLASAGVDLANDVSPEAAALLAALGATADDSAKEAETKTE